MPEKSKCYVIGIPVGILCLAVPLLYWITAPNFASISISSLMTQTYQQESYPGEKQLQCLFDAHRAFAKLNVSWFISFGSALFYHRNQSFKTHDIDTGMFYDDLLPVADKIESIFLSYKFSVLSKYGTTDHGREWTFACPRSGIRFDIFVFYRPMKSDAISPSFAWWTASYRDLCDDKKYRKCRFKFSAFQPELIEIRNTSFPIAPIHFLIEAYGPQWKTPINYGYAESLKFIPNLINE